MRKLPNKFLFISCIVVLPFFYCKKQVDIANFTTKIHKHLPPLSLQVSNSNVKLYQANAKMIAVRFDWGFQNSNVTDPVYYTLQLSLKEDQFSDPVEIALGSGVAAGFTVEEFNQYMHKLISPGDAGEVAARVKYMHQNAYNSPKGINGEELYYSDPVLLRVTTYRQIIEYNSPNFLTIPGNYQSWNPLLAPRLVSKPNEKEYEAYVYFPIEYPQFLFIQGNQWSDFTFGHIGNNKFGFKGTPLSIFGGKGFYIVRASMNTNTWSYAKIKSWGIFGSALGGQMPTDLQMAPDPNNECIWRLNVNLIEGEFKFRANNENQIVLGNQWPAIDYIPDYNSDGIRINKAANYTIELDLSIPGNYIYHLRLNRQ